MQVGPKSGIKYLLIDTRTCSMLALGKLGEILDNREDLFVVQIGSNDGMTADPLYCILHEHPSWKALLVEPVPYLCGASG